MRPGDDRRSNGSIPSYQSAKLLVREDGSMVGTIGGGCVEAEVWNAAREVIETEKPRRLSFNLGQDAAYDNGLICGGQMEVFVEPVTAATARFHLRRRAHLQESVADRLDWPASPPWSSTTAKRSPTASAFRRPSESSPASTRRCSRCWR